MFQLKTHLIFKFVLAALFFAGLSWTSLFLAPKTVSAESKTIEELYVQPIPGLKAGLFGISTRTFIESLINDNYQAYCAAPSQKIGPEVLGEYRRFLEIYFGTVGEDGKDLETTVSDPSAITNPDISDDSGDGFKGESVVEYQYRSKTDGSAINSNINTISSNRQLSLFQQCKIQEATRKEVIARCQDLKDTLLRDCPLNIDIPGMPGVQIADIVVECDDLKDSEKFAQIDKALLKGMANTPNVSVISTNKKPAYLMICFHQAASEGRWFDETKVEDKKFYLSSIWSWINSHFIEKKDDCSIRSILVDVALTEQNPYLESYPLEAHDLAKKSFMSLAEQVVEEEKFKSARSNRKELSLGELASGFSSDKRINLKNNDDEIKKALAFIVNGTAPSCGTNAVRQEEAPTIGSQSALDEGGAEYKSSDADAHDTWSKGGILASLITKLKTTLFTGKRKTSDFEGRVVTVESFIFAPYSNNNEKVSLEEFFVPKLNYDRVKAAALESWPTHVEFNNFLVSSGTNKECESFEDPDDCKWETKCDDEGNCWQEWVCKKKNFCLTGKDLGQQYSSQTSDIIRSNARPLLSLLPNDSPAWKHANNTLGSLENLSLQPNIEKFLKSGDDGDGSGENDDLNSICEVADAYNIDCDFFKAVYAVESCSGTVMPTQQYGDLNCCNSIGYCGPMAFGGAMVDVVAPGENLDVCKEESQGMDNFILAARWMLIKKWCNFNSEECLSIPNPYDWKESYIKSEGNPNITTQTEVEDFILGWYGSINQIEDRVGWPEGSTYVDAVMEYLRTGSLWGACGYQEP